MSPKLILAVALGGALGSVGRYLSMTLIGHVFHPLFPWGTLFVNVAGSFAMGVLAEASALVWSPSPELRALLAVGLLGGFTTFSTFSLDVAVSVEKHDWPTALAYTVLSVILSVGALFAGLWAVRQVAGG